MKLLGDKALTAVAPLVVIGSIGEVLYLTTHEGPEKEKAAIMNEAREACFKTGSIQKATIEKARTFDMSNESLGTSQYQIHTMICGETADKCHKVFGTVERGSAQVEEGVDTCVK